VNQPVFRDGNGDLEVRWKGKTLAILGTILVGLSGGTSFIVTHIVDQTSTQQQLIDRINNLEKWQISMEIIAKENTEGRIRMEQNQQFIIEEIKNMHTLMQEHEQETHKILQNDRR